MDSIEEVNHTSSFTCVMSLDQQGVSSIPERYVLPASQRPNPNLHQFFTNIPIIDMSSLHEPSLRSQTLHNIASFSKEFGVFLV